MKKHGFVREANGNYSLSRRVSPNEILAAGREILSRRFKQGISLTCPQDSAEYLISQIGHLDHEVFYIIFLDNRHRILSSEIMFQGTIDGAPVYCRTIAKRALELNAAALLYSHNHPSQVITPSESDKIITRKLKESMSLFDIRSLDHIIVSATASYSFADHGLM